MYTNFFRNIFDSFCWRLYNRYKRFHCFLVISRRWWNSALLSRFKFLGLVQLSFWLQMFFIRCRNSFGKIQDCSFCDMRVKMFIKSNLICIFLILFFKFWWIFTSCPYWVFERYLLSVLQLVTQSKRWLEILFLSNKIRIFFSFTHNIKNIILVLVLNFNCIFWILTFSLLLSLSQYSRFLLNLSVRSFMHSVLLTNVSRIWSIIDARAILNFVL